MKRAMGSKRKRSSVPSAFDFESSTFSIQLLLILFMTVVLSSSACRSVLGWQDIGVQAFGISQVSSTKSFRSPSNMLKSPRPSRSTVRNLSNNDNDNDNDNDDGPFDFNLLARRFERADKTEIRNDATLVVCYVVVRFLIYDVVTSGSTKIMGPGGWWWVVQPDDDWIIGLTGTFSSATVLVSYYVIAGLLTRTYDAAYGLPSPNLRALVNVALCTPAWLATERWLHFGPPNIGGDSLAQAVTSGFLGFGSFMALAKTLTSELMR